MHIAIIPDGNRRWASQKGLLSAAGHEQGAAALEALFDPAIELGVTWLTCWGLSIANLKKRNRFEIASIERIIRAQFRRAMIHPRVTGEEVAIRVLGDWHSELSKETREVIEEVVESTKHHAKLFFTVLLAYDGERDMVRAVQAIASEVEQGVRRKITASLIKEHLVTRELPSVDLLIRTGGDPHLSAGFMMWEMQNAQLVFPSCLWPEFTPAMFRETLLEFRSRTRRFGS